MNSQPELTGTVIATYRKHTLVEDKNRQLIKCQQRKTIGQVVCGDIVTWVNDDNSEGVITGISARRSLLQRPDMNGKLRIIAANIDQIIIITSPKPEMNEGLIDRYLVAAETSNLTPVILLNKTDLLNENELQNYQQRLNIYQKIGYDVLYSSTKNIHGLDELTQHLSGKNSIFVGQSGVGKSSLINTLFDDSVARVAGISDSTGKGKHTTTTSYLYTLKTSDGHIIDSPGVREFGITDISEQDVIEGFIEFRPYIGHCKFRDCKHNKEPGCALLAALEKGEITEQRWQSSRRIIESLNG